MPPFKARKDIVFRGAGGEWLGLLPPNSKQEKTMKKLIVMAASVASMTLIVNLATPTVAQPPNSLKKANALVADIHEDIGHLRTLYCQCPYVRSSGYGGDIDREACGLEARNPKNEKRSDRVEWEHVVPASWLGERRSCWKSGHPLCGEKDGRPVKGRDCCSKSGVDPEFLAAYSDPHNLFPASGEINGDRSNFAFGKVNHEPREYGSCDFEVGGAKPKVAEPATSVRGELARAMLYMRKKYGVKVRMAQSGLLSWHRADPPELWEIERAKRIREQTGLRNRFVTP